MKAWDGGQNVSANGRQYATVAASQVADILGDPLASAGNTIDGLWIFPATTTPGTVIVLDDTAAVWTWPAGITVDSLAPIFIPLNLNAVNGPWKITTGADVSVLAWGVFG